MMPPAWRAGGAAPLLQSCYILDAAGMVYVEWVLAMWVRRGTGAGG